MSDPTKNPAHIQHVTATPEQIRAFNREGEWVIYFTAPAGATAQTLATLRRYPGSREPRPPPPDREARIALMRALVDVAQIHGASGEGYSIPLNEAESALLSAFDALAGERDRLRDDVERERRAWDERGREIDRLNAKIDALETGQDAAELRGMQAIAPGWRARAESAERALGEARANVRTLANAIKSIRARHGRSAVVDDAERLADALAAAASPGPGVGIEAQVRAVLADVNEAIRYRKECGAADQFIADFDTVGSWLTLALAGCYIVAKGAASPGTTTGAGPHLACFNCGLEHGPEFPQEPTVQPRPDGKTRCNDCERKRLCSHPAGFTRDGRKFCVRCGENMPKPAPESPGSATDTNGSIEGSAR
jgi:hypothetical protein